MPSARRRQWFTTIDRGQTVVSTGQKNVNLLAALDAAVAMGTTVQRMILDVTLTGPNLATDFYVYWGITYVNADAVIGSTLPDPNIASDNVSWLARGVAQWSSSNLSESNQDGHIIGDFRSQRVCRSPQDQLHFIVNQEASGFTVTFDVFARVLLLLR